MDMQLSLFSENVYALMFEGHMLEPFTNGDSWRWEYLSVC